MHKCLVLPFVLWIRLVVCSWVSKLSRYFPYGVNGMLTGSATVFFAYIGFDTVASTAEEVRKVPSAKARTLLLQESVSFTLF
jgi:amino acid transporter